MSQPVTKDCFSISPISQTTISLLLPTRGRPNLVMRFLTSVIDTAIYHERIEIILYVDEDDIQSHYIQVPGLKIERIIGPKSTMGTYNSKCLERSTGEIIILVNDDLIIRTPGWDNQIAQLNSKFKDGVYLAYCNDLFKKEKNCSFPILSRRATELLGRPFPEEYIGSFIDTHIFDIFKRLQQSGLNRIFYFEDIIFEHMHFRNGKAEFDNTYRNRSRFGDDLNFYKLKELRSLGFQNLAKAITNNHTANSIKFDYNDIKSYETPKNFSRSPFIFLFDTQLPFDWRLYFFIWFTGRRLAEKGWLWPFVKP